MDYEDKVAFMTQTKQPHSWTSLSEAGNYLTINKSKTEDKMGLLLSVLDSLNDLCETLSKLSYALQRKNMVQTLYQKDKGKMERKSN